MPQVRCAQCGALNSTTAADYPFCIGCQDNLAKCGYCRWFEAELEACTQRAVAGVFEATADATPPCDQHTPGALVLAPRRSVWPAVVVGVIALLVLAYSLVQFRRPGEIPAERPQSELQLSVEADLRGAVVGKPYLVTAEIRNVTGDTISGIGLQLSEASLGHFRLVRTRPRADAVEDVGEWEAYRYADLLPHETRRIVLDLIPTGAGRHHLAVRLVSRGSREYHGMADFPIQVAPASLDGGSGRSAEERS